MAALGDDPQLTRLAPLLNAVMSLDVAETVFTDQMSGQARADNTNELLLKILTNEARERPLLVLVEDAHWLDSASLILTVFLARQLRPSLVVIATRPLLEPLTAEQEQLVAAADDRFRLEPLADIETIRLVAQRLGVRSLPPEVAELITRKAQGNPFFSEELAYALRDAGVLLVRDGECIVPPGVDLTAVTVPDSA